MTVNNYFKTWTPAGTIWGVFPFDDSDVIATRRAYEDAKSFQRHAELASPVSDDVNEQPDRNDPRPRTFRNRSVVAYRPPRTGGPWSSCETVRK